MHVHSRLHGASSIQNDGVGAAKSTDSQPFATAAFISSNGAGDAAPATTAISDQTTSPAITATAKTASGASSDPFTQLSTNLQALLLGVGQAAQSATGAATATATQALNAYGATSSFLSPATL